MTYNIEKIKSIVSELFILYVEEKSELKFLYDINNIEVLVKFCKYHRLDMILYDKLLLAGRENTAPDNLDISKQSHEIKANEYDKIARRITEEFQSENISFVFLKGYALYLSLYKKKAHRYYNDLDILISPADISRVTKILKKLGLCYGYVRNGIFMNAKREDIIYQRLNTHELQKMVLENKGEFYNIDVNFLFSWIGVKNEFETMQKIPFSIVEKNIKYIKKEETLLPILNYEFQFLHLCSHFYNEAVFFALDRHYIQGDPEEIILIRLLDIVLLLNTNLDFNKIKKICDEYNFEYKVQFVLKILMKINPHFVSKSVVNKFDLDTYKDRNYYYINSSQKVDWKIDIITRIFEPQNKVAEILESQTNGEWAKA